MENKINELKQVINSSQKIVVFSGAGLSVPSGIPDFRSAKGIYSEKLNNTYSPEMIISHSFFLAHPDVFFEFYKSKMVYPDAIPNIAHQYFKTLEDEGKLLGHITQNIDGLDLMAGSHNVIELHGSVRRNYCMKCHKFYSDKQIYQSLIPKCDCGGIIKPDVVLYEESLDYNNINNALRLISEADTLIVVGTSLVVEPAASFVRYFGGDHLVLLNKTKNALSNVAEIEINDDIEEIIKKLLEV